MEQGGFEPPHPRRATSGIRVDRMWLFYASDVTGHRGLPGRSATELLPQKLCLYPSASGILECQIAYPKRRKEKCQ